MSNILDEYVGRIFEGLFVANFCSLQTKYEYLNTNSDVRHLIDASEQETLEWLKSRLHKAEGRPFIFNCHNQKIDVFLLTPRRILRRLVASYWVIPLGKLQLTVGGPKFEKSDEICLRS